MIMMKMMMMTSFSESEKTRDSEPMLRKDVELKVILILISNSDLLSLTSCAQFALKNCEICLKKVCFPPCLAFLKTGAGYCNTSMVVRIIALAKTVHWFSLISNEKISKTTLTTTYSLSFFLRKKLNHGKYIFSSVVKCDRCIYILLNCRLLGNFRLRFINQVILGP